MKRRAVLVAAATLAAGAAAAPATATVVRWPHKVVQWELEVEFMTDSLKVTRRTSGGRELSLSVPRSALEDNSELAVSYLEIEKDSQRFFNALDDYWALSHRST